MSARAMKATFEELKDVSVRTIQRVLQRDLGYESRNATRKPLLMDAMKKKRIAFAEKHISGSVDDCKQVMYLDESTFRLVQIDLLPSTAAPL